MLEPCVHACSIGPWAGRPVSGRPRLSYLGHAGLPALLAGAAGETKLDVQVQQGASEIKCKRTHDPSADASILALLLI